jgi:hypothetical protein
MDNVDPLLEAEKRIAMVIECGNDYAADPHGWDASLYLYHSNTLTLAGLSLPRLPVNFNRLVDALNLDSLDCQNNRLETLPSSIGELSRLISLDL